MHAQNGTVGSPEFQDVETYEVILTIRIPKNEIDQTYEGDKAADIGDFVQGCVLSVAPFEVAVRSRAL